MYWHKDLKISGQSYAYDATIGNYSHIVTNSSRSAMIITLCKDKTVCVLVDAAGNQAVLSLHVHYTAIEEEQSLEQALEGRLQCLDKRALVPVSIEQENVKKLKRQVRNIT